MTILRRDSDTIRILVLTFVFVEAGTHLSGLSGRALSRNDWNDSNGLN